VPNQALWWIAGCATGVLALVLAVPFLRELFQFGHFAALGSGFILAGSSWSVLISESLKLQTRAQVARWGKIREIFIEEVNAMAKEKFTSPGRLFTPGERVLLDQIAALARPWGLSLRAPSRCRRLRAG